MTDDDKALVERLRINDREIYLPLLGEAADEIDRLREALRDVFKEWNVIKGFIPKTETERHLVQTTRRMANIAYAALGGTK